MILFDFEFFKVTKTEKHNEERISSVFIWGIFGYFY